MGFLKDFLDSVDGLGGWELQNFFRRLFFIFFIFEFKNFNCIA